MGLKLYQITLEQVRQLTVAKRLTFFTNAKLGIATSEMGRIGGKGQAPTPTGREVSRR